MDNVFSVCVCEGNIYVFLVDIVFIRWGWKLLVSRAKVFSISVLMVMVKVAESRWKVKDQTPHTIVAALIHVNTLKRVLIRVFFASEKI